MKYVYMTLATLEATDDIFRYGATGMWRVRPASVHDTKYVVMCARPNDSVKSVFLGTKVYSAFLIGEISGLTGSEGRYRIMVNKVAELDIPNAWEKGSRFPFLYSLTDGLKDQIDLDELDWMPVPACTFA